MRPFGEWIPCGSRTRGWSALAIIARSTPALFALTFVYMFYDCFNKYRFHRLLFAGAPERHPGDKGMTLSVRCLSREPGADRGSESNTPAIGSKQDRTGDCRPTLGEYPTRT